MTVPANATGSEAAVCSGGCGSGDDDEFGADEVGRGCANWGAEPAVVLGSKGGQVTVR